MNSHGIIGFLRVEIKGDFVLLDWLLEFSQFIQAGGFCKLALNVLGVEFQRFGVVLDRLFNLV